MRAQLRRLASTTIILVPVIILAICGMMLLKERVAPWAFWKLGLVLVVAGEIAYGVIVVVALAGAAALGIMLSRRDNKGMSRLAMARGLLLCLSLLVGFLAAEAIAVLWEYGGGRLDLLKAAALDSANRNREAPSGNARLPAKEVELPSKFDPDPPGGHRPINIVILGESSAEGVPYGNWVSIGNILQWQLERLLLRPVNQYTLAMAGQTLELQTDALARNKRRPDAVIVYCGHNEISQRVDWARDLRYYLDDDEPTLWQSFVQLVETVSPLCGLLRRTADECRVAIPPPRAGHRGLVDTPVYTSREYDLLLADFRRRLEAIVSYAERVGAAPVLVAPAANDADFEPSRSVLPASARRAERATFRRDFEAALRLRATNPAAAIIAFRALVRRQPGFAESHYRLAQLLEAAGQSQEAYPHFVSARDLDGYPVRCLTSYQNLYREIAARHRCILIDSQAYFHAIGHHGLLDNHLFNDAMHPSLRGQIALAQAILHEFKERAAFGWPRDTPAPAIDPAECVRRFGLVPQAWHYICLWGIMFYDLCNRMRYDPAQRLQMKKVYAEAAERIESGAAPESVGLPNIGAPEPVPLLPELPRQEFNHHP
jgi:lysophospholipase L1-like esterase